MQHSVLGAPDVPHVGFEDRLELACVEEMEGQIGYYADVARTFGLTPSRITQITALLWLSPALLERSCSGMSVSGSGM